jgi:hypothetical protein
VSNQYPGQPGQPGDLPPTQVAPGHVPPQPGPPPGYPQQPQQPYGAAPGGGYPPPGPPPFGAPPTGGGGGKKVGLIIGIIVAVLVIVGGGATAAILVLSGDDDEDADRPKVTATVTASTDVPTDVTSPTDVTTDVASPTDTTSAPPSTEPVSVPTDDPTITGQAYLDSLVTGDCLAVEGLSTPEWWSSEYGSQRACKKESPNADMSQAQYDFEDPIDNGDGSQTLVATITAPDVSFTGTWTVVPSDDGTVWLVDFFLLA